MCGFRARDFQHQHPSLASGRVLFSYCGADPSRAKNGLPSPASYVLVGGGRGRGVGYGVGGAMSERGLE
jgi:hypothetical protein